LCTGIIKVTSGTTVALILDCRGKKNAKRGTNDLRAERAFNFAAAPLGKTFLKARCRIGMKKSKKQAKYAAVGAEPATAVVPIKITTK
jgi:hypothetical protein